MTTYSETDFQEIAAAVGSDVRTVAMHGSSFEATARSYRLDRGVPYGKQPRRTPTAQQKKLQSIRSAARRLLGHLGVESPATAANGPRDREVLQLLSAAVGADEDQMISATERVGRLAELIDGIAAAGFLEQVASDAIGEAAELAELTVTPGHSGDRAINDWLAAMMVLYRRITGWDPATSVGAWGSSDEGMAGGPLIRFLQAAAEPLQREPPNRRKPQKSSGVEIWQLSTDALRSRVRTVLNSEP